ncbi:hypothetical protein ACP70R_012204 [Stipagrostis hirtigluma subsp. patula]
MGVLGPAGASGMRRGRLGVPAVRAALGPRCPPPFFLPAPPPRFAPVPSSAPPSLLCSSLPLRSPQRRVLPPVPPCTGSSFRRRRRQRRRQWRRRLRVLHGAAGAPHLPIHGFSPPPRGRAAGARVRSRAHLPLRPAPHLPYHALLRVRVPGPAPLPPPPPPPPTPSAMLTPEKAAKKGKTVAGCEEKIAGSDSEDEKLAYVHVRAQRGNTTDSHSLAARVSEFAGNPTLVQLKPISEHRCAPSRSVARTPRLPPCRSDASHFLQLHAYILLVCRLQLHLNPAAHCLSLGLGEHVIRQ